AQRSPGLETHGGSLNAEPPTCPTPPPTAPALQAYLLGPVEFEAALALQRRLVYQVTGDPATAALVLCEHPPLITLGREARRATLPAAPADPRPRRWPVRWVNRGGGTLLHLPGQLAVYPVLSLAQLGLGLQDYLDRLQAVLLAVLDDFRIRGTLRPGRPGVWVNDRLIASVGVAARSWVTYYGAALNVNPDLRPFRLVHCGGPAAGPMTSLES